MGEQSCLVVSDDKYLNKHSAKIKLQLGFLLCNVWIDEHSIHKLVQHSFPVAELSKQIVVVYFVLCLLLESMHYSDPLEKPADDAFPHLWNGNRKIRNCKPFNVFYFTLLILIDEQLAENHAVKQKVFKGEFDLQFDAARQFFKDVDSCI